MSYYYGYDYYGTEEAGDDKPPKDMHHEEKDEKSPMMMAMMLVPVFDGISWYVTNDKWSAASNSDWTNAYNSMLAGAIFKAVVSGATMAMMDAMHMVFFATAGLSAVWELANLYLINKAHGTAASTTNSTKIAVGLTSVSAALSAGALVMMMGMEKDDEADADEYYEEAPADEGAEEPTDEGTTDSGYGGYYGYYY